MKAACTSLLSKARIFMDARIYEGTGKWFDLSKKPVKCAGFRTFAGVQLSRVCAELMRKYGQEEPAGKAKITPAHNLPCEYVLHTVGPVIQGRLTKKDERLPASCYRSCLNLAEENGVDSIAFCCISIGEFHFSNARAAEIVVETVKEYKGQTQSRMKVIFSVFKQIDYEIYRNLLGYDKAARRGN